MLYQNNEIYNSSRKAKQDKPANVALKLFLSFLLVFSMIPSGLSLQSFANSDSSTSELMSNTQDNPNNVENAGTSDSSSGDSTANASNDETQSGESSSEDKNSNVSENNNSENSDSSKSESDETAEDKADGLNLPIVQAVGTTIYWSPIGEDIKEGETVIVKAGNDRFDGSGRNSAVRTWSRVQELMKEKNISLQ